MGRATNRLSARAVATAGTGYHCDGAGLYLLVAPAGSASWVFRYTLRGRKREMGLGSAADFTLAQARERASAQRRLLADGVDPIEARRAAQAQPDAPARTWGQAKAEFIAARAGEWRNQAQRAQWEQSLAAYGPADSLPVAALDTDAVVACLRPEWRTGGKVETMTRVRGRIERIWDAERVRGFVSGENPARWRGHLEHLLPRPAKVAKTAHHAAMPYGALPGFWRDLVDGKTHSRAALQFAILTAARTAEVTGARWAEFDLQAALWTVPAARMKAGREHVVPLVPAAVTLLRARQGLDAPFAMSEAAMLQLLQRQMGRPYTVHGFRSAFRDWCAEETDFPGEVAEMALAHVIADETEAAYRRGNLLTKRRALMEAWAAYLAGPPMGNVVPIRSAG